MTTKPTIEADKAVGSVLGAAEWNVNALQQARWTQEVIAGTNSDKIPGAALANPLDITGASDAGALRWTLTGSQKARIQPMSTVGIGLFANGRFDGSNTQRDDTAAAVSLLQLTTTGLSVFYAAAGANPASLTTLLGLDTNGKLTGSGFWESGEVTITTGNSATFNPGFGVQPRFVWGYYGSTSGAGVQYPLAAQDAPATAVHFNAVTAGGTVVFNSSGSTMIARVNAIR